MCQCERSWQEYRANTGWTCDRTLIWFPAECLLTQHEAPTTHSHTVNLRLHVVFVYWSAQVHRHRRFETLISCSLFKLTSPRAQGINKYTTPHTHPSLSVSHVKTARSPKSKWIIYRIITPPKNKIKINTWHTAFIIWNQTDLFNSLVLPCFEGSACEFSWGSFKSLNSKHELLIPCQSSSAHLWPVPHPCLPKPVQAHCATSKMVKMFLPAQKIPEGWKREALGEEGMSEGSSWAEYLLGDQRVG